MSDIINVLYSEEEIKKKVKEISNEISKDYGEEPIYLIGILKGAIFFVCDIARELVGDVTLDFMSVSSYGNDTKTSGVVRIIKDLDGDIEGKNVIIIEDIVDSGLTLSYLRELLQARKPKSIKLCTLLNKESRREKNVNIDYEGFKVGDQFIVGYGIDYAQKYRNLPYIGYIEER